MFDLQQLGVEPLSPLVEHRSAGERIIVSLHHQLSLARVFGHYIIHEAELARQYSAGRTVVREVLMRLRDVGLVEKRPYSPWLTSPLTAVSITNDYELRAVLEPHALRKAQGKLGRGELQDMSDRIRRVLQQGSPPIATELQEMEDDLHVHCLRFEHNAHLRSVLGHAQGPLSVGQIFSDLIGADPQDAMLHEHLTVYGFLQRGAMDAAAVCLEAHLREAASRTLDRLKVLSVVPEPALPGYLERLK